MAAKGTMAKQSFINRLAEALGDDYLGTDETGKKYYVNSKEDGQDMVVCLTLTVPKNDVNIVREGSTTTKSNSDTSPWEAKMGDDEKATLDRLVQELNL